MSHSSQVYEPAFRLSYLRGVGHTVQGLAYPIQPRIVATAPALSPHNCRTSLNLITWWTAKATAPVSQSARRCKARDIVSSEYLKRAVPCFTPSPWLLPGGRSARSLPRRELYSRSTIRVQMLSPNSLVRVIFRVLVFRAPIGWNNLVSFSKIWRNFPRV